MDGLQDAPYACCSAVGAAQFQTLLGKWLAWKSSSINEDVVRAAIPLSLQCLDVFALGTLIQNLAARMQQREHLPVLCIDFGSKPVPEGGSIGEAESTGVQARTITGVPDLPLKSARRHRRPLQMSRRRPLSRRWPDSAGLSSSRSCLHPRGRPLLHGRRLDDLRPVRGRRAIACHCAALHVAAMF